MERCDPALLSCITADEILTILPFILNFMGIEYADVNVLADEEIRQGIKDFSDWPTVPQLYVKGEFVGGCDIITEMTLSGELDTFLEENGVNFDKDAADKIREANAD